MEGFIWSKDKEMGIWPEELRVKLVDPTLNPKDYDIGNKLEYRCDAHGVFEGAINDLYINMKKHGELLCPKCSRLILQERMDVIKFEKYGKEYPTLNKEDKVKMNKLMLGRYNIKTSTQD